MRPQGGTPPPLPSVSSTSMYPPMFSSNNPSITHDPHHQYNTFGSGFAAVACSSNGYSPFFPSKSHRLLFISNDNLSF